MKMSHLCRCHTLNSFRPHCFRKIESYDDCFEVLFKVLAFPTGSMLVDWSTWFLFLNRTSYISRNPVTFSRSDWRRRLLSWISSLEWVPRTDQRGERMMREGQATTTRHRAPIAAGRPPYFRCAPKITKILIFGSISNVKFGLFSVHTNIKALVST